MAKNDLSAALGSTFHSVMASYLHHLKSDPQYAYTPPDVGSVHIKIRAIAQNFPSAIRNHRLWGQERATLWLTYGAYNLHKLLLRYSCNFAEAEIEQQIYPSLSSGPTASEPTPDLMYNVTSASGIRRNFVVEYKTTNTAGKYVTPSGGTTELGEKVLKRYFNCIKRKIPQSGAPKEGVHLFGILVEVVHKPLIREPEDLVMCGFLKQAA